MSDKRVTRDQAKKDPRLAREIDKFDPFKKSESDEEDTSSGKSDFNTANSNSSIEDVDIQDDTIKPGSSANLTPPPTPLPQPEGDQTEENSDRETEENMSTTTNISFKDALRVVPEFDGKLSNLSNFLEGCQEAKDMVSEGSEANLVKVLRSKLVGEARKAIIGEKFETVEALKDYIRDLYVPAKTVHQLQGDLGSLFQRENESVLSFANRIREVGKGILEAKRVANNGTVTNEFKNETTQNIIECFKNGLKPEIGQKMVTAATVKDVVKNAINAERIIIAQNDLRKQGKNEDVNSRERRRVYFCEICNKEGHQTEDCRSNRSEICYICKKTGHKTNE